MKLDRDEIVAVDGHPVRVEEGPAGAFEGDGAALTLALFNPALGLAALVDEPSRRHARITTDLPGCPPLALTARPGSYFVALGRQDARLGHAGFDDRYIVKTDSLAAVRLWLGATELEAILATYDTTALQPFALAIAAGKLTLVSVAESMARVDQAIAAAGLIATRPARLAAQWAEPAAALGGRVRVASANAATAEPSSARRASSVSPTDAGFALALVRATIELHVDFPWRLPAFSGAGLRTRVWASHDGDVTAAGWRPGVPRSSRPRVDDLDDQPWIGGLRGSVRPVGWLDDHGDRLAALIADAAIDWLVISDHVAAVGWESYVDDLARLRRAADLVEMLVRPPVFGGPYR